MVGVVVNSDILHDGDCCALNGTWSWREEGKQVVESPEELWLVKEKEERRSGGGGERDIAVE